MDIDDLVGELRSISNRLHAIERELIEQRAALQDLRPRAAMQLSSTEELQRLRSEVASRVREYWLTSQSLFSLMDMARIYGRRIRKAGYAALPDYFDAASGLALIGMKKRFVISRDTLRERPELAVESALESFLKQAEGASEAPQSTSEFERLEAQILRDLSPDSELHLK